MVVALRPLLTHLCFKHIIHRLKYYRMKIRCKVLIMSTMLCLASMVTMANESPVFSVKIADDNSIVVQLTDVNQPQIQVTLKDAYGVILHDELLTESNINHRKYNFRNLPVGNYTLIVAYDDVIKIQSINKAYKRLEIEASDLQTIFRPVFRQHSEFVDIGMLYFANMNTIFKMRDSEGRVIYSERIKDKGTFKKRLNLSKLEQGSYILTFEIDGVVVNEKFEQSINWSPGIAAL